MTTMIDLDKVMKDMWTKIDKERNGSHIIEDLCKQYGVKGQGETIQFKRYDPMWLPKA